MDSICKNLKQVGSKPSARESQRKFLLLQTHQCVVGKQYKIRSVKVRIKAPRSRDIN